MRKMKGALLIGVVTLASEPTWAQPPNEVYSFDVISDTVIEPGCPTGCPVQVPYHLATLTITHEAFADRAANLTHTPDSTVDDGVVSLVVGPLEDLGGELNYPPTALAGATLPTETDVAVELTGDDISGTIDTEALIHDTPHLFSMRNGIDDHWIGQWSPLFPDEVHNFIATATRVLPAQASR